MGLPGGHLLFGKPPRRTRGGVPAGTLRGGLGRGGAAAGKSQCFLGRLIVVLLCLLLWEGSSQRVLVVPLHNQKLLCTPSALHPGRQADCCCSRFISILIRISSLGGNPVDSPSQVSGRWGAHPALLPKRAWGPRLLPSKPPPSKG